MLFKFKNHKEYFNVFTICQIKVNKIKTKKRIISEKNFIINFFRSLVGLEPNRTVHETYKTVPNIQLYLNRGYDMIIFETDDELEAEFERLQKYMEECSLIDNPNK